MKKQKNGETQCHLPAQIISFVTILGILNGTTLGTTEEAVPRRPLYYKGFLSLYYEKYGLKGARRAPQFSKR